MEGERQEGLSGCTDTVHVEIRRVILPWGAMCRKLLYFCRKLKTMKRTKIVKRIADLLHKIVPDASVILYGSEARGDARPDSDIDFLVLLDSEGDSFRQQEWMVTEQLMMLEAESDVPLSPYIVPRRWWNQKKPTPFSINVKNEGILL